MDAKHCSGIKFIHAGRTVVAKASKEILLSAGAIGSVQILERSGIGNAQHLKALNIKTIHDLPGVGEN
jgi:choline dehydrogenase